MKKEQSAREQKGRGGIRFGGSGGSGQSLVGQSLILSKSRASASIAAATSAARTQHGWRRTVPLWGLASWPAPSRLADLHRHRQRVDVCMAGKPPCLVHQRLQVGVDLAVDLADRALRHAARAADVGQRHLCGGKSGGGQGRDCGCATGQLTNTTISAWPFTFHSDQTATPAAPLTCVLPGRFAIMYTTVPAMEVGLLPCHGVCTLASGPSCSTEGSCPGKAAG